jgi:hypothetical protein
MGCVVHGVLRVLRGVVHGVLRVVRGVVHGVWCVVCGACSVHGVWCKRGEQGDLGEGGVELPSSAHNTTGPTCVTSYVQRGFGTHQGQSVPPPSPSTPSSTNTTTQLHPSK